MQRNASKQHTDSLPGQLSSGKFCALQAPDIHGRGKPCCVGIHAGRRWASVTYISSRLPHRYSFDVFLFSLPSLSLFLHLDTYLRALTSAGESLHPSSARMNCPSRVDPVVTDGYNQNPNAFNADATTRADMDHMANARLRRDHRIDPANGSTSEIEPSEQHNAGEEDNGIKLTALHSQGNIAIGNEKGPGAVAGAPSGTSRESAGRATNWRTTGRGFSQQALRVLRKYAKFIGPGFMVAVAYIDPGTHFP